MRTLAAFVALPLSLLAVLLTPLLLIDRTTLEGLLEHMASERLGREVTIGKLVLHGDAGVIPAVAIEDLAIANPAWAGDPYLLDVSEARLSVDLPASWHERRLVLADLSVRQPRLWLERLSDGRRTWALANDGGARAEAGWPIPVSVERLRVSDGLAAVRDAPTRSDFDLRNVEIDGALPQTRATRLELAARLGDAPVALEVRTDPPRQLERPDAVFGFDLTLKLDQATIGIAGAMDPEASPPTPWSFRFEAPTLAALPQALDLPLPDTAPVLLEGSYRTTSGGGDVDELSGRFGESPFDGALRWQWAEPRPRLSGWLRFEALRLADLGGVVGAGPNDPALLDGRSAFPEVRFDGDRLFTFDADLQLEAGVIQVPVLPIEALSARLRLVDGRAELDPLRLRIAGGTAVGEAALNGREAVPSADLDLAFKDVRLAPFFAGTRFFDEMGGRLSGDLYLLGVGASVDRLLAAARGDAHLRMDGGTLSGLAIEGLGLDVVEALALFLSDDTRVPIACAIAEFTIAEGVVRVGRAVADTRDSVLRLEGSIDLGNETLAVAIRADPKDFSLVDVTAPVRIKGPLPAPEIAIGELDGLPFFELGDATDADC